MMKIKNIQREIFLNSKRQELEDQWEKIERIINGDGFVNCAGINNGSYDCKIYKFLPINGDRTPGKIYHGQDIRSR